MRRACLVIFLVGLLALRFAPAPAKGAISLSIAGPGLTTPIELNGTSGRPTGHPSGIEPQRVAAIVSAAQVYAHGSPTSEVPVTAEPPAGDLGPRYVARYVLVEGDEPFVQHLYPFGEGGPVAFVPAGQECCGVGGAARTGWLRVDEGLPALLVAEGVPQPGPASAPADDRADFSVAPILGGLAAVGVASTALFALRRRTTLAAS